MKLRENDDDDDDDDVDDDDDNNDGDDDDNEEEEVENRRINVSLMTPFYVICQCKDFMAPTFFGWSQPKSSERFFS